MYENYVYVALFIYCINAARKKNVSSCKMNYTNHSFKLTQQCYILRGSKYFYNAGNLLIKEPFVHSISNKQLSSIDCVVTLMIKGQFKWSR